MVRPAGAQQQRAAQKPGQLCQQVGGVTLLHWLGGGGGGVCVGGMGGLACALLAGWVSCTAGRSVLLPTYLPAGLCACRCWSDKHCVLSASVLRCVLCCAVLCVLPRALVFVSKFFGGMVPTPCDKGADKASELGASVSERLQEYVAAMEKVGTWICSLLVRVYRGLG